MGGIRTLDTGFRPYNGLANRRLQPLGHHSNYFVSCNLHAHYRGATPLSSCTVLSIVQNTARSCESEEIPPTVSARLPGWFDHSAPIHAEEVRACQVTNAGLAPTSIRHTVSSSAVPCVTSSW